MRVRKKRVLVTVTRDALGRQPPGWLSAWAAEIESHGCLAPGDGLKLAERIAESLPLNPDAAFHLLHASDRQVDIGLETRLQVVSPILREGAAPGAGIPRPFATSENGTNLTLTLTANLIGYETAWYAVEPKADQIGFAIAPLYAERNIQGETERRQQPATNYLQFPAEAAFYRVFYKADQTKFTALIIAARTRVQLEQLTKTLDTGTASCKKVSSELCVAIPKGVAINPFLAVTVNGSEVMVTWESTVRGAIRQAGEQEPEEVLPHLAVYKLYRGRPVVVEFDRSSPAILDLLLSGGEIISWR